MALRDDAVPRPIARNDEEHLAVRERCVEDGEAVAFRGLEGCEAFHEKKCARRRFIQNPEPLSPEPEIQARGLVIFLIDLGCAPYPQTGGLEGGDADFPDEFAAVFQLAEPALERPF